MAKMAIEFYDKISRGTGRTTRLVDIVGDDDIIVCATTQDQRELEAALFLRNKSTLVYMVEPTSYALRRTHIRCKGQCYMDHDWVYMYFQNEIRCAENVLAGMTDLIGGN